MNKLSKYIVKYRNLILLCATLLLIPCLFGYLNTRVNYDILSYLPAQSESMQAQKLLEDDFNLAGTAMVIVDDMPDEDIQSFKQQIEQVPGVEHVLWRDDIADIDIPADFLPSELSSALYSQNSSMIIVTFTNPSGSDETMQAIYDLQNLVKGNGHVAGFSAITADTKTMVNQETPIYTAVAVLLCLLVLSLGLRSWLAPFIFLAGMIYPIVYNMGTNIFLGEISYLTKALSMILLLAVSMDYSIFLLHRYQEEKQKGLSKEDAMAAAIHATFVSITSSSITTIAGFLALVVMQLTLGRDIGLVMAKGVLLAVLSTILILPSLLMFFDPWIEKWQHPVLIRPMPRLAAFVSSHCKSLALCALIVFVPFLYFQSHTSQYYDLAASLPQSLDSVQGTQELKDKFDMNTTHFVIVDDDIAPQDMNTMLSSIEKLDGVTSVIAYEKLAGPMMPDFMEPQVLADFLQANGRTLFVVNSQYRAATDEVNTQLDSIKEIASQYDPQVLIAGEGPLTEDLIHVTDVDFTMVNLVSIALIFIIIAVTFRSLLLPVILVGCIELAISINMGIPYLTHTQLPFIAGIVIGTIQLGACIDYAILLTTRFREELALGKPGKEAIRSAITMTSPSIVTSGLSFFAACSGVSLIAKMDMIRSLCILLGRGALISIVVILTVLPSFLLLFSKAIAKTTKNWPKTALCEKGELNHA